VELKVKKPLVPLTAEQGNTSAVLHRVQTDLYLFNGQFGLQYSDNSCNAIVKKIHSKQYHMHTLRHSAATGLYEKELISN
jgi:integrase